MATKDPEIPHTQTSAPVKPPRTTEDVAVPQRDAGAEGDRTARRKRGDETGEQADRMPLGADEPGAGL